MKKTANKFPTPFIRNRRQDLGLTQLQVRMAIGMEHWAYEKMEQRGHIPEEHIPALAKVLQVSEKDIWVEKLAPMVQSIFGIAKVPFMKFVNPSL